MSSEFNSGVIIRHDVCISVSRRPHTSCRILRVMPSLRHAHKHRLRRLRLSSDRCNLRSLGISFRNRPAGNTAQLELRVVYIELACSIFNSGIIHTLLQSIHKRLMTTEENLPQTLNVHKQHSKALLSSCRMISLDTHVADVAAHSAKCVPTFDR